MNLIRTASLLFALSATATASAQTGQVVLPVEFVGATSSTHPVQAAQGLPSFGFDSTIPLGTCPLVDGKVYFEGNPDDTAMLSVMLAAQASGAGIRIYWDDTHTNTRGYCKLAGVRAY